MLCFGNLPLNKTSSRCQTVCLLLEKGGLSSSVRQRLHQLLKGGKGGADGAQSS